MTNSKIETPQAITPKKVKKKSFLRLEAIVPFLVMCLLVYLYFFLFFDKNLKSSLEYIGYQVNGAEVNIGNLNSNFRKASILIENVEVTDPLKPHLNSLFIKKIEFKALWDALLRARLVIDNIGVNGIQVNSPRKKAGKLKPPPPPEPVTTQDPSKSMNPLIEKEGQKVFSLGLDELANKNQDNALLNSLGLMTSGKSKDGIKLDSQLKSKAQLEKVKTLLETKKTYWNQQSSTLPNQKDMDLIKKKFEQIKTKDFKTPQELQDSLKALDELAKEANGKLSTLQSTSQKLQSDFTELGQESNKVNDLLKEDRKTLESLLKIPSIDAASLSKSIFLKYLITKLSKYQKYMDMAQKYLPKSVTDNLKNKAQNMVLNKQKKSNTEEKAETTVRIHPRQHGVNYEFSSPRSYPLFWIKDISISSKSNGSDNLGNLQGSIKNIVSNQRTINKSTTIVLQGDFPSEKLMGFSFDGKYDNLTQNHRIQMSSQINSYPLSEVSLLDSPDAKIGFANAVGSLSFKASLDDFKKISIVSSNLFNNVNYNIDSQNQDYKPILNSLFNPIKKVTLDTKLDGDLPQINLSINSNLGEEIQKNIQAQIQAQLNKAKAAIDEYLQKEVGKNKQQIEAEINTIKSNLEGQISKAKKQVDDQKSMAENKVNASKKDAENKAKKEVEDKVKSSVEDLKKKFGF